MADEKRDDDPAFLPAERMRFYERLMAMLRENGNREIVDAVDRVLFAPFTIR